MLCISQHVDSDCTLEVLVWRVKVKEYAGAMRDCGDILLCT